MPRLTSLFEAVMQLGLASPLQSTSSADLRLNHIQVIGTHNSYHREVSIFARPIFELLLPTPQNFYYSHASLHDQLTHQSVRSLELDVFADYSSPGQFADPLINRLAQLPSPPKEWQEQMRQPGAKVLHVTDIDVGSVCPTFRVCLSQLLDWSESNPDHVPIIIDVEFKTVDERIPSIGGAPGEPWNATTLALLDHEIRDVLGNGKIISPDDVRLRRLDGTDNANANLTLEDAVLQFGWPSLDESRGKFLFIMDNNPDDNPSLRDVYRADGHKSLEGRVIFTNSLPGEADAAFIKRNDPSGDNLAQIQDLVRKGYLVRTRADEPINSVLTGDDVANERLERALETGAQVVSTDWPGVGMASRYDSDYVAKLPEGGVVRCNPVNAPDGCNNIDLERYVNSAARGKLIRQGV